MTSRSFFETNGGIKSILKSKQNPRVRYLFVFGEVIQSIKTPDNTHRWGKEGSLYGWSPVSQLRIF